MTKKIASAEQFAAVANYHAEKNFAKKFERGIKKQRIAELMAEGIEKSIAQDMVRFGLA